MFALFRVVLHEFRDVHAILIVNHQSLLLLPFNAFACQIFNMTANTLA